MSTKEIPLNVKETSFYFFLFFLFFFPHSFPLLSVDYFVFFFVVIFPFCFFSSTLLFDKGVGSAVHPTPQRCGAERRPSVGLQRWCLDPNLS